MTKLIKKKLYHKLINNELVYDNKSINRYQKDHKVEENKSKYSKLERLRLKINSIKNCDLKKNATNIVFSDGNPNAKL